MRTTLLLIKVLNPRVCGSCGERDVLWDWRACGLWAECLNVDGGVVEIVNECLLEKCNLLVICSIEGDLGFSVEAPVVGDKGDMLRVNAVGRE